MWLSGGHEVPSANMEGAWLLSCSAASQQGTAQKSWLYFHAAHVLVLAEMKFVLVGVQSVFCGESAQEHT